LPTLPTFPTLFSLFFYEGGVIIYKAHPRISWMHKQSSRSKYVKLSNPSIKAKHS
jgi:hypothetical protein